MIPAMLSKGKSAVARYAYICIHLQLLDVGQPSWIALRLFQSYVESSRANLCEIGATSY